MAERVGIAIVGAGFIADYHLTGLAATTRAATRVIVSRGLAKAEAVARKHGVAEASDDYARVLARGDIDAVVITTPDDTHEALTLQAIAAGKAVLLQKPMATTSASCRRMIAAAEAAGVDLQVSFMHRFFEEVVKAQELLAAGAIGAVTSLRMRNATPGPDWGDWFFDPARVSGGVIHQLGVHGIDLLLQLGGAIAAVQGRTATLRPQRRLADGRVVAVRNPDSAWATYQLAGGAIASHEMSMIEAQGCDRFRLEIYGEAGTMWLRSERGALAIWAPEWSGKRAWVMPDLSQPAFGQRQHQHWLDGVVGAAPRAATAREALAGILVAEAIERSAAAAGASNAVEAV